MVKVDNERDYYADLEIPLNSTTEDVKKQFRKLGKTPKQAGWRATRINSS